MPRCDTEAMNLHLAEIATQVAPGAHAVVLADQAGWHLSGRLILPPNITLVPLPAKCPELNPQEKRLAVPARQLALKPHLRFLRPNRRPLLRGLEQARRSALAHHVDRNPAMGISVLISESWY
jgi:hypothetical protein